LEPVTELNAILLPAEPTPCSKQDRFNLFILEISQGVDFIPLLSLLSLSPNVPPWHCCFLGFQAHKSDEQGNLQCEDFDIVATLDANTGGQGFTFSVNSDSGVGANTVTDGDFVQDIDPTFLLLGTVAMYGLSPSRGFVLLGTVAIKRLCKGDYNRAGA
jgi:hypothetical protein